MDTLKKRSKVAEYSYKARQRHKKRAFELLGNKCAWCPETNPIMLQIDHIEGAIEAKTAYGRAGSNLYFLVSTGRKALKGLQLLCANCNVLKRHQNEEHAGYKERKVNESRGPSGEGKSETDTGICQVSSPSQGLLSMSAMWYQWRKSFTTAPRSSPQSGRTTY